MSRKSPGFTSSGSPLNVVPTISFVPRIVLGGDLEDVALGELVRAVLELAEPDLGALQVDEHRDGTAGVVRRLPHVLVDALVHVVAAVAEVHARDVDARIDDRPDLLIARCRRPEGGDDLRSSHLVCAPVFRAEALGGGMRRAVGARGV